MSRKLSIDLQAGRVVGLDERRLRSIAVASRIGGLESLFKLVHLVHEHLVDRARSGQDAVVSRFLSVSSA